MNYSNLTGAIAGLSIGLIIFVVILTIACIAVIVIANWKIFEKNGEEGWKAIIPFYNSYIFTKIAGLNWWYALILIFGDSFAYSSNNIGFSGRILAIGVNFLIFYNLAKKAKKDPVEFGILGALFTPIMEIIMGFSNKYQFDNSAELNPNGLIGEKMQNQNTNSEPEKYCLGCGQKLKPNSKFCENCGKEVK